MNVLPFLDATRPVTLGAAFETWKAEPRAPRTVEGYASAVARLEAAGLSQLEGITPARVWAYLQHRAKSVKPGTANSDLMALTSVLSFLERAELFPYERLRRIRRLKIKVPMAERWCARFLTRADYERLCAFARSLPRARPELTLRLAVLSGLRLGEVARLRWQDVDLEHRSLRVRNIRELGARGWTKTGRERVVPMAEELVALLRPIARPDGVVLGGDRGAGRGRRTSSPSKNVLERDLRTVSKLAGVEADFRMLRHTRASWWIQAGVSLSKCAAWLGHSPDVCSRFYAALVPGYDADAEKGGVAPDDADVEPLRARLDDERRLGPPLLVRRSELTKREAETLELARQGLTCAEIGERLGIAAGTAKVHVKRLYARVGAHRRADLDRVEMIS